MYFHDCTSTSTDTATHLKTKRRGRHLWGVRQHHEALLGVDKLEGVGEPLGLVVGHVVDAQQVQVHHSVVDHSPGERHGAVQEHIVEEVEHALFARLAAHLDERAVLDEETVRLDQLPRASASIARVEESAALEWIGLDWRKYIEGGEDHVFVQLQHLLPHLLHLQAVVDDCGVKSSIGSVGFGAPATSTCKSMDFM